MTTNWTPYDTNKPEPKKAKNHCQMKGCRALIKYKCSPTDALGDMASPIFVCERDMPHWRDKYYHISPATMVK